mgnify:CR=1 FL=1
MQGGKKKGPALVTKEEDLAAFGFKVSVHPESGPEDSRPEGAC